MRLAVFSDIHGNLEALEAFITDAAGRSVDHYICLGDIVGYGANPGDCFDRMDSLPNLRTLLGNHDAAVTWQASPYEMSPIASKAIMWTMEQLSSHHIERLHRFEELIREEDMVFCHANPYHPRGWRYLVNWYHAQRSFLASNGRLIFVGHTHRPGVMIRKKRFQIEMVSPSNVNRLVLDSQYRYIINCGAIGQPRDGNPDGSYIIFDNQSQTVEFIRFVYDIEGAARRIRDAGLPGYLSNRLFKGR